MNEKHFGYRTVTWYAVFVTSIILTTISAAHPFLNAKLFVVVGTMSVLWGGRYSVYIFKNEIEVLGGYLAILILITSFVAWKRYDDIEGWGLFDAIRSIALPH